MDTVNVAVISQIPEQEYPRSQRFITWLADQKSISQIFFIPLCESQDAQATVPFEHLGVDLVFVQKGAGPRATIKAFTAGVDWAA